MELLICRKFVDKNFPLLHINKVELLGQPLILAFMVILGEGAGREELFESFFSVNLPDILEQGDSVELFLCASDLILLLHQLYVYYMQSILLRLFQLVHHFLSLLARPIQRSSWLQEVPSFLRKT